MSAVCSITGNSSGDSVPTHWVGESGVRSFGKASSNCLRVSKRQSYFLSQIWGLFFI